MVTIDAEDLLKPYIFSWGTIKFDDFIHISWLCKPIYGPCGQGRKFLF